MKNRLMAMPTCDLPTSFVHAPEVAYRAHRDYVHSTTMYEQIVAGARAAGLEADGQFTLKLRRLVRNQPEFRYVRQPEPSSDDAPMTFSLEAGGALWHGAISERDMPVQRREPYDETPIWNNATQEGRGVRLATDSGKRPIEAVTALTLWLHRRLFAIPDGRKWFLSRLDLQRPLSAVDARGIRIDLMRNVGTSMTRSSITADDGVIGHIEFMLGNDRP